VAQNGNGELTEWLRVRVSPTMKAEVQERASASNRSPSAVARAAIRSYLLKGKR
jgi:predicted transcriptional regulator